MENTLLGSKVVFIRDHFVYSDGTQTAGRISYKGQMGKVVAVNPFRGEVTVVVCPENITIPMTTVDVSYLQLIKKERIEVQSQVLEFLKLTKEEEIQARKHTSKMAEILEDMKVDSIPSSLGGSHGKEG